MSPRGRGIIATGHPEVSLAALEMLRRGGNAYDAAVAAGFTSAVAEVPLTSLGGGGFLLAQTRAGARIVFDFFSDTPGRGLANRDLTPHFFPVTVRFPGSDQDFNIGLGSIAVPGNLMGFLHVHGRLGSLPLKDVLEPAVKAARQGVVIGPQQAHFLKLLQPILTLSQAGRAIHAPDGRLLSRGERLVNHNLAEFLEELEHDQGRRFYEGEIAARIAADMECSTTADELGCEQGLLTFEDLCSYKVIERPPLAATYRGMQLFTNPPPSFGGSLIAAALTLLEQLPMAAMQWGTPAHLAALVETQMEVERLRQRGTALTPQLLGQWQQQAASNVRRFSRGTTHLSIVDKEGNVAAMTTSNGEGSGYIVPGTGIMLNNMMGEDDLHPDGFHAAPAGQRVASMMSPSVLVHGDDAVLVIGSGGSKRIRTAITQVISHLVDFGLDIKAAVDAPRLHWDGSLIQIEPGFAGTALEELADLGGLNIWPERNVYFGGVHAVVPGDSGAGDPRRGGDVRIFE